MRELIQREPMQAEILRALRKTFEDSLKDYKGHLLYERQMSEVTVENYTKLLFQFYLFLGKDLTDVTKEDFRDFIAYLKFKEYRASTVNTYLNTLRSHYNFLANNKSCALFKELAFYINKNFRIKKERIVIQVPSIAEINKLRIYFRILKRDWHKQKHKFTYEVMLRDIAIFEVLIATGIRSAEIRGIRANDFDLGNKNVLVRGKGGHQRFAIYSSFTRRIISEHLQHNKLKDNDLVFKMAQGNMLNYIIKRWAKRAAINPHIHAHSLRHYHITVSHQRGVSLKNVQNQVGHIDLSTTGNYIHFDLEFRKKQYADKIF